MRQVILNLVLAIVWCLLTGSAEPWNFIGGLLVGAAVVHVYGSVSGTERYLNRVRRLLRFTVYFFSIMVKANFQIAREVITPGLSCKPRILRYPVAGMTDVQRTTLSSAISLTPGTLVADISPDSEWLYIHCMYGESRERAIADIDDLAKKLKEDVFT